MLVSVTECKMRHKVGFLDTYNDGYWKKSIFKKLIYPISESNISNFTYLCLKNSENPAGLEGKSTPNTSR